MLNAPHAVLVLLQVWSIRVDVHVLDSGGNLIDACCLAALAALLGFRKPQVEVDQSKGEGEAQVTVFSPEVRAGSWLTDSCLCLGLDFYSTHACSDVMGPGVLLWHTSLELCISGGRLSALRI